MIMTTMTTMTDTGDTETITHYDDGLIGRQMKVSSTFMDQHFSADDGTFTMTQEEADHLFAMATQEQAPITKMPDTKDDLGDFLDGPQPLFYNCLIL